MYFLVCSHTGVGMGVDHPYPHLWIWRPAPVPLAKVAGTQSHIGGMCTLWVGAKIPVGYPCPTLPLCDKLSMYNRFIKGYT